MLTAQHLKRLLHKAAPGILCQWRSADQVDPHPWSPFPGTGPRALCSLRLALPWPVWPCCLPATQHWVGDNDKRTMSGKARLSLFEIVKLTPFNGQRQGRIILFMTLSSSLPLGELPFEEHELVLQKCQGYSVSLGVAKLGDLRCGGTGVPLKLGVSSGPAPLEPGRGRPRAGFSPAVSLRLYGLKLGFAEPNPSHSRLCILGR